MRVPSGTVYAVRKGAVDLEGGHNENGATQGLDGTMLGGRLGPNDGTDSPKGLNCAADPVVEFGWRPSMRL